MRSLSLSAFVVLLLLSSAGPGAHAIVVPGPPLPTIELGYSPASLTTVSQGTPIYTAGDEVWLMSDYNQSVYANLIPPNNSTPARGMEVPPGVPVRLYTFSSSEPPGTWILGVRVGNSTYVVADVLFELPPSLPAPSLVNATILTTGNLSLSFREELGGAYDGQTCVVGSRLPTSVVAPYKGSAIAGSVALSYANGSVSEAWLPVGRPQPGMTIDFWMEMYYAYSYQNPQDPQQVYTTEVLAARTPTVSLSGGSSSNQTVPLADSVALREGRYDIRAFFRDSRGLSVYETTALFSSTGPWVWFGGCRSVGALTNSFSVGLPVSLPNYTWPGGIFTVASQGGVEGFRYTPIGLNLTRVSLTASPWNARLPSYVSVNAATPGQSSLCRAFNGSVYCLLSRVPAVLDLRFGYGGTTFMNATVDVQSPGSIRLLGVPLGKLVLNAEANGSPAAGATVQLSLQGRNGTVASGLTGASGTSISYLFAGNYSLYFHYGSYNLTEAVRVNAGSATTLNIEVAPQADYTVSYALLGLAGVGIVLNLWVWRGQLLKRPAPGRSAPKHTDFLPVRENRYMTHDKETCTSVLRWSPPYRQREGSGFSSTSSSNLERPRNSRHLRASI